MTEHNTNSPECWCNPSYFIPCSDCEKGCWKCDEGKIYLTLDEALASEQTVVVVHNYQQKE